MITHIGPQRRGLGQAIRGDRCVLSPILQLHPPPGYVTPDPRSHILIDLDHDEEDDAVYHDHAEEHHQVYPFRSAYVDLKHVHQNILSRDLGEVGRLVVEHQALQVVLVLPLEQLLDRSLNTSRVSFFFPVMRMVKCPFT